MKLVLDRTFAVGDSPTAEELRELARQGFRSVVDLRDRTDGPLSPLQEAALAARLGLQYLNFPVHGKRRRRQEFDAFRRWSRDLPGPIFVHDDTGRRSMVFGLIEWALRQKVDPSVAIRRTEDLGYEWDSPFLRRKVEGYIDEHWLEAW
jgi:protein tyrosine phosphatase (PTP) superfamily phosphohydrolase (DUF442 family)